MQGHTIDSATQVAIVASPGDPRWRALISGQLKIPYRCLALKIMMIRVQSEFERNSQALAALTEELRTFFANNARFAAEDYRAIFGGATR